MRQSISRQAVFALAALWGVVLTMSCPAARGDDAPRRNLVLQAAAPPAAQSQRLALVIGNSTYKDAPLSNPVNDARAMANALRTAGFTVLLHTDVDHRAMLGAVREFGNRLRQGGVGVFYFAGHGMQIKGRNYLIPVGADIQREDELAYAALDAQAVLDKMEAAGNGTNLMILDACRNNPFARSFRSSTQGLAQMEAPVGTLVAFATAPGSVASDGQSANGLYTQHLLSAMLQPGAKVEDVFKQVRAAVRRDSQGKQIPWEATSLEGDLYFIAPPPKPTVDASLALDDAMWDGVKGSGDPSDLRAYLRRFPTGRHVAAASQQLSTLAAAAAPATAPASPTPAPPAAQPQSQALASAMTLPLGRRDTDARDRLTAELLSELASAPTSATNSTTLPQGGRDTDARDRRTAELLTGLASASTSAVNLPTSASKPSTVPARNAQGFTVGDRWNYQVIDRYRGEVVRNFTVQVASIDADGRWRSSSGAFFDKFGRVMQSGPAGGEHSVYTPHAPRWWPDMKTGDKRRLEYQEIYTSDRGEPFTHKGESEARVFALEKVIVPAGEFMAYRIEHNGTRSTVGKGGFGTLNLTIWYVPEVRGVVAMDTHITWDGRPGRRERSELTSVTLVGPPPAH